MRLFATIALFALSSLAFAQSAIVAPPATAPAPAPISPAVIDARLSTSSAILPAPPHDWNGIAALIADFGSNGEFSADVLGFAGPDQPWLYRQIGIHSDFFDDSTPMHTFAVTRGAGQQDVFIAVGDHGGARLFRAHRNGQVVSAFLAASDDQDPTPIPLAEAQRELNAEFDFWSRNVERATHWYACMADLGGANSVTPDRKRQACTWLIQSGKESPLAVSTAYVDRSWSYETRDRKQQFADLNQAVAVAPGNADAWAHLCAADNWIHKDTRGALQACHQAVELDPNSPEGWTYRGDIDLRTKKYQLAIANYDQAIALQSEWLRPFANRGEAYLQVNQVDRALEDFGEVIRLSPGDPSALINHGIAEMRKNDLKAALADFQSACKVDSEYGGCLFGQGLVKRARGDSAAGNADIAQARKLDPRVAKEFAEDGVRVP